MDFTKMNRTFIASFKNAKRDLPFKRVNEIALDDFIYKVNGVFSSEGKFGIHYFVSLEKGDDCFNFGLPVGQNENAKMICDNAECVAAINNGECGIKISTYHSKKYNRECVNVEWVNITPF